MNIDDWERIFNAIGIDNSLSEHNVIDKIKEELRGTYIYELWEKDNFNINHEFTIQHMYSSAKHTLLRTAAVNRNPKILRTLLDKGADINVQVETALRGARFSSLGRWP
ncbi:hypothetical protein [Wolbachia endosymbiont (group A) of Myopa testacea]|uniref:hypothetical protein n=1 Tax=Wolbachia endosymbiont (group A) of Myopa testacea TaxID=3066148 RepID=UPI00333EF5EA